MKAIIIVSSLLLAGMVSCNNASNDAATTEKTDTAVVATTKTEEPAPQMDSATMMKKWQENMTPGDMHKMMASWDGKWKMETSMWMSPDAPPQTSTGTMVNKMVFGGRYQQGIMSGSYNGMPFEGMSTLAYDNAKKMFVSTWIDNMGTGIMMIEGAWDAASKSMNMKGKCMDQMTGKDTEMREVFKVIDDKNQVMEMYATQNGKEMKTMEIKFTKM